jgi:hypothetical protein
MGDRPRLTRRQEELSRVFRLVMGSGRASQQLYLGAEEVCGDPEPRQIVEGLYQDEVKHEKVLLERYKEYRG